MIFYAEKESMTIKCQFKVFIKDNLFYFIGGAVVMVALMMRI